MQPSMNHILHFESVDGLDGAKGVPLGRCYMSEDNEHICVDTWIVHYDDEHSPLATSAEKIAIFIPLNKCTAIAQVGGGAGKYIIWSHQKHDHAKLIEWVVAQNSEAS